MSRECPNCSRRFEEIGIHWSKNSNCSFPSMSEKQEQIITGLLMGDGSIDNGAGKYSRVSVEMISEDYLEYLDSVFGVFSKGVRIKRTSKENARHARERGFREDAQVSNYSNTYLWRSMNHPDCNEFRGWYSSGRKIWPEDIELTPTTLKHWYCGDGSCRINRNSKHIILSTVNEFENKEKIDNYFDSAGLPTPSNYEGRANITFTVSDSDEIWEYMEEPVPGFEYKWPEEYRKG